MKWWNYTGCRETFLVYFWGLFFFCGCSLAVSLIFIFRFFFLCLFCLFVFFFFILFLYFHWLEKGLVSDDKNALYKVFYRMLVIYRWWWVRSVPIPWIIPVSFVLAKLFCQLCCNLTFSLLAANASFNVAPIFFYFFFHNSDHTTILASIAKFLFSTLAVCTRVQSALKVFWINICFFFFGLFSFASFLFAVMECLHNIRYAIIIYVYYTIWTILISTGNYQRHSYWLALR